jgi:hypothetical protein
LGEAERLTSCQNNNSFISFRGDGSPPSLPLDHDGPIAGLLRTRLRFVVVRVDYEIRRLGRRRPSSSLLLMLSATNFLHRGHYEHRSLLFQQVHALRDPSDPLPPLVQSSLGLKSESIEQILLGVKVQLTRESQLQPTQPSDLVRAVPVIFEPPSPLRRRRRVGDDDVLDSSYRHDLNRFSELDAGSVDGGGGCCDGDAVVIHGCNPNYNLA